MSDAGAVGVVVWLTGSGGVESLCGLQAVVLSGVWGVACGIAK